MLREIYWASQTPAIIIITLIKLVINVHGPATFILNVIYFHFEGWGSQNGDEMGLSPGNQSLVKFHLKKYCR